MRLFGLRLHLVVLVTLLGLAAAYAGQRLYVQQRLEAPLIAELAELAGVEEVTLGRQADGAYQVTVRLASGVRLPRLYRVIRERVEARLGPEAGVDLEDRRSPQLLAAWDAMGFALQEGASTARLEAMRQRVEELASTLGVESRLFVDEDRIYVTLEKDGRYLHEVVERLGGPATSTAEARDAGSGGA